MEPLGAPAFPIMQVEKEEAANDIKKEPPETQDASGNIGKESVSKRKGWLTVLNAAQK